MMMISKLQTYRPASASTTWDENIHDDIVNTGNDNVGGGAYRVGGECVQR